LQKISFKNSFVWKHYFEIKRHVNKCSIVSLYLFHLDPTIENRWCGKRICKKGKVIKRMAKIWQHDFDATFMVVFQFLIFNSFRAFELPSFCKEDSIFGVVVSNEDIL
jgi:hypothetical protein